MADTKGGKSRTLGLEVGRACLFRKPKTPPVRYQSDGLAPKDSLTRKECSRLPNYDKDPEGYAFWSGGLER